MIENAKRLRGDIFGGVTSSIVTIPIAIALGVSAFAPFGPSFASHGALAGLYGVIIATILCSIFGSSSPQITCPTAPLSLMLTSIILIQLKSNAPETVLLYIALVIALSGLFQILLGLAGGGKLIKFIPYPVVAGFMNGIALVFFVKQIRPFLGLEKSVSYSSIFTGHAQLHYGAIIAGLVTIAATEIAGRLIKRIPGDLIGLLLGILAFFIVGHFAHPEMLKAENNHLIIGPFPSIIPSTKIFSELSTFSMSKWHTLLIPAITMAVLAVIESLLATVVVNKKTKMRHDSNKEVIGQGLSNIVAGLFGGVAVGGALPETVVNISNGGFTRLSKFITGFVTLIVAIVLSPLAKWIPLSVLAGLLIVTSCRIFDYRSMDLYKRRSTFENSLIVLIVTAITVSVDLVTAVVIGLVISAFLFVKEQIVQTIVRKKYTGAEVHSKTVRDDESNRILEENGHFITIYDLSGSLFFGTCDQLLTEIEEDEHSRWIIFNLNRVNSLDITGAQILIQIIERIHEDGHQLLLANLDHTGDPDKERLRNFIHDLEIDKLVGVDHIFPDTDLALEWAEDALIAEAAEQERLKKERLRLKDLSVFGALTPPQMERVQKLLKPKTFRAGEIVFRQGDPGDGIYFILFGHVDVFVKEKRLATFAEGVFFGDMAILDDQIRSATVISHTDTQLLFMSKENFFHLIEAEPLIANQILLGISRELANRLRVTSNEISVLD